MHLTRLRRQEPCIKLLLAAHRVQLLENGKATLEEALHFERGHSPELKAYKETLTKQVELLMTLRLAPPKVGFLGLAVW